MDQNAKINIQEELTIHAIELDKKLLDFKFFWQNSESIDTQKFDEIMREYGWLQKECFKNKLDENFIIGEDTKKDISALMNDIAEYKLN